MISRPDPRFPAVRAVNALSGPALSENELQEVVDLLGREFFNVFGVLCANKRKAGVLSAAIDAGDVQLIEKAFPPQQVPDERELHGLELLRLERLLFDQRSRAMTRLHANYIDALAVRYVEQLNWQLRGENK